MSFHHGRCFYCRCQFSKPMGRRNHIPKSNDPTSDHVWPRKVPLPPGIPFYEHPRNKVRACWSCNNRKGGMHPIGWLTLVADPAGAADLAGLMVAVGYPQETVQSALERRKANAGSV